MRGHVQYVLENETVSGANARRVMNGEKPVVEVLSEEVVQQQKELTEAYMQLSLVDSYSVRDGVLTTRIADEEVRTYFGKAYEKVLQELGSQMEKEEEKTADAERAKRLLTVLSAFTVRDRRIVLDKYSALLYHHSLDRVSVEETVERVKRELEAKRAE